MMTKAIDLQIISVLKVVCHEETSFMKVADVSYLHACSNYTFIHHSKKTILSAKTLGFYHNQLSDLTFIRTHKSYSVNINHIDSVNYRNRVITLKSGKEIPFARARKKMIKDILSNHFAKTYCEGFPKLVNDRSENKDEHNQSMKRGFLKAALC